ncbi:MAG: hypothetical protein COV35_09325 [Alphaproteobacteria bacterium CG11_big_fil_rev_8_21_14_0_20_39_49]|nr:MAG: hypothetical protein COV35_09325 [Alphaproteobacteria bacterium CG11_big_fil_rev_8_21_14_0_20_39_49]
MISVFKKNISRDFDKAAGNYDEHATVQRKAADNLFSRIKGDITNNNLVLDAGCGTGYLHELLRRNKIYCPLFQTDISYNMCKVADGYASPPEYGGTYTCRSDIENLPFAPSSIDLVFSSLTLQWTDAEKSLRQIYNVLKPKGKIAIATIGCGTLSELRESSLSLGKELYINDNFVKDEYLKDLFVKSGFKNIEVQSDTIRMEHDNLKKLLISIKGVGAGYKAKREVRYLGKNYFVRLEEKYKENFCSNNKLIAGWNIIYVTAEKS